MRQGRNIKKYEGVAIIKVVIGCSIGKATMDIPVSYSYEIGDDIRSWEAPNYKNMTDEDIVKSELARSFTKVVSGAERVGKGNRSKVLNVVLED